MDHMTRLIVFIYYLLALLNNTKINCFKIDLIYYLDLVNMSNKGLNIMANLGVSITSKMIDCKKKKMLDTHKGYIENSLEKYIENAFVLNINNYHNIYI